MYMVFIHAYFLTISPTTTHQICTNNAAGRPPFKTAITQSGLFLSAGTAQYTPLAGAKAPIGFLLALKLSEGIENMLTNSKFAPAERVDKLQGLRSR